ncbi:restriction endonuclease [Streptomyces sp. NPDC057854]|uniref:restriction endonuclease n=1 Tax=unclassified Streptomyces TaxID=2593676 RepID=UPI0036A93319
MAAVGDRGRGAGVREGSARLVRDLVLVVGLVGVVIGGAALTFRTARSAGSYVPAALAGLVLLLLAGAALARWSRSGTVRGRVRGAVEDPGARGAETAAVAAHAPEAPAAAAQAATATPPAVSPETTRIDVDPGSPAAMPPPVDGSALDHLAVDPDGFEHTVAALCARDGCSPVEVVGGAGDLGADVIATTPDGRRVVLQCKQYGEEHRVGSPDLQRFGGTCFAVHEADVAVLVTTSTFTEPALAYAASCGIVCVDGTRLAAWTASTAPSPWEAARGPAAGDDEGGSGFADAADPAVG